MGQGEEEEEGRLRVPDALFSLVTNLRTEHDETGVEKISSWTES